tara:strand:+ start:830 stop:1609 length:780 start_codon:yes stop_codon:yes gene_type:complete
MDRENREDFGIDLKNPILTTSIAESYEYLSKLITDRGEEITYERTGSYHSPSIKMKGLGDQEMNAICDGYNIFNQNNKQIAKLYICPYFKKVSKSAPAGFKLRTAESIKNEELSNVQSYRDMFTAMSDEELLKNAKEAAKERGIEIPKNFDISNLREFMNQNNNPRVNKSAPVQTNEGCFIATASVGSYDNKIVLQLRKFRDNWIKKRFWGDTFIKLYYKHGKIIASYIKDKYMLKKFFLLILVMPAYYFSKIVFIFKR